MKTEVGSFTAVAPGTSTILLTDTSLVVKGIIFHITSNQTTIAELSTGFSDAIKHRSESIASNASKFESKRSTSEITHYRITGGSTMTKVLGFTLPSTSFATAGQFDVNVATLVGSVSVDFMVYGV